jgi:hypothetical protein
VLPFTNEQRHFWIMLSKNRIKNALISRFYHSSRKTEKEISKMKIIFFFFALIASVAASTASEYHLKALRARKYNSASIIEKPTAWQMETYRRRRASVRRWLHINH